MRIVLSFSWNFWTYTVENYIPATRDIREIITKINIRNAFRLKIRIVKEMLSYFSIGSKFLS